MGIQKITPAPGGRTQLTAYSEALVQSAGVSGNVNLDLAQANDFVVIAGAGDVTIGFANPPAAGIVVPIRLRIVQDGVGGRRWTFPASVKWTLGVTPQWPVAANAAATVQLVTFDGGATYIGTVLNMDAGGAAFPLSGVFGAGADYAPVWTADAHNPLLGNGTLVGRHIDIGKLCVCTIDLVIGSTTIIRNDAATWRFTAPHNVAPSWTGQGLARFVRASGAAPNAIDGQVLPTGGNVLGTNMASDAVIGDMNAIANNTVGGIVVANGDGLSMMIAFEMA